MMVLRRGIIRFASSMRRTTPMDKIFAAGTIRKGDVFDFLTHNSGRLSTSEVIHYMYMCSKNNIELKSEHLKIVARKLENENSILVGPQIGKAIYSLQKYACHTPPERSLVAALTVHLDNCMDIFNSHSACNMLYGLQRMTSKETTVRRLLDILSIKIARCPDSFSGSEVASALYGLRNMDSSHFEVRCTAR
jgi:hypothetical protein